MLRAGLVAEYLRGVVFGQPAQGICFDEPAIEILYIYTGYYLQLS